VPDRHVIPVDSLAHIVKLSNKFNVSREVYLRRVKESGLISNTLFFDLLEEIKASYAKMKEPGGFAPPEVKSRASRGPTFYNLVLEGLNTNRINYTDASQLLDLKINRILSEL
jgi:Zn-dependent peptidase ImmA (M78 family)